MIGPGAKAACPQLAVLLKSAGEENIREIVRALERIGKDSAPALLPLLKDVNPTTRSRATQAMSSSRQIVDRAVPDLVKLLEDPDAIVRADAIDALASVR